MGISIIPPLFIVYHGFFDSRDPVAELYQGHHVWNAAHSVSAYLQNPSNAARLIHSKSVLELGAGAGIPGIVASILGAAAVVITDYPDADLVENIQWNIDNSAVLTPTQRSAIAVEGHAFGASTETILAHLSHDASGKKGFDTLILADLLFNHHCHAQLIVTIQRTLAPVPSARALVFFSPYRPWLLNADLAFFALAEEGGFVVEKIGEELTEKVMFRDDPGVSISSRGRVRTRVQDEGFQVCILQIFCLVIVPLTNSNLSLQDEKLRRTIFMYELKWSEEQMTARNLP